MRVRVFFLLNFSLNFVIKMSYTTYINADSTPVERQEWDINRPPNMMYYDYGQTMRYHEAEETERTAEIKQRRETEHKILGERLYEFEGMTASETSADDWQPWMQRTGIPVAQQRLMDLPDPLTVGATSFGHYLGFDKPDTDLLDNGYQSSANENSVFRSHRIDQYIPQDAYT